MGEYAKLTETLASSTDPQVRNLVKLIGQRVADLHQGAGLHAISEQDFRAVVALQNEDILDRPELDPEEDILLLGCMKTDVMAMGSWLQHLDRSDHYRDDLRLIRGRAKQLARRATRLLGDS